MNKASQIRDFCHVEDVVKTIIETLNFKKRSGKFPQIWDMATGKEISVKSFAKKIKLKCKNGWWVQ